MFESTKIIGRNQYNKAKELSNSATATLSGPVDHRLEYVDMSNLQVSLEDGETVGCKSTRALIRVEAALPSVLR